MAPPSVFTRPKRQILGTVATSQRVIDVSTESGLIAAIGLLASKYIDVECGCEIRIVQTFTITQSIVIPATLRGLIICSNGFTRTDVASDVLIAFDVRGLPFAARGLHLVGTQGTGDNYAIKCTGSVGAAPTRVFQVSDCTIDGFDRPAWSDVSDKFIATTFTRLLIRSSSGIPQLIPGGHAPEVSFCMGADSSAGPSATSIFINVEASGARILSNYVGPAGAIGISTGSGATIIGNHGSGGVGSSIDTSGGGGTCVIVGNTGFGGGYFTSATDDEGLNT
jgi:hypothetical protein